MGKAFGFVAVAALLFVAPAAWAGCGSDSQCKVGKCSSGTCGNCGSDSDCKGHSKCSSGKCNHCGSDSDCGVGKCSSGKCSNRDDYLK